MKNLNELVDFLTDVTVKSQSFATFYILKMLEYDNERKVAEDIIDNLSEDKSFLGVSQDDENIYKTTSVGISFLGRL